jgi:oligopeptide/dipeptide ABC transporter ATP-binding protein
VGIADPERRLFEYPHQMSGGMRQRVMMAMALSCKPKLLIADEPTTALDVTIQAQILELLRQLQQDTGMAILLITHDLGVVAENADVVAVMYASRIVEVAGVEEIFDHPQHPYTQGLLRSIPRLGADIGRLQTIAGAVPNPAHFPTGCKFHPRCLLSAQVAKEAKPEDVATIANNSNAAKVLRICAGDEPLLRQVQIDHWAACHLTDGYAQAQQTEPILEHKRPIVPRAAEPEGRAL